MKKLLPIVFALLIEAANAQTPFVQSRFSGKPILDTGAQCVNCMPHKDGVLEYRIANHRVETNTATFSIQLRVLGGDPETTNRTRLAFASVRLTYNPLAFGNNAVANRQCSYEAAPAFRERAYRSSFNDTTADMLTVTMVKMKANVAADLVALDNTFQDFITMHCVFEREEEEADIAISGTDILPNMIYVYNTRPGSMVPFVRRSLFPLAHNSLRGFRLDGKNYALDYARYSDGKGVFLRFSDDLNTNLEDEHFSIDKADEAIAVTRVVEASDATARVEFDQAVSDGILRSSQDVPIIDHEGTPLASGAFLAALEYDAHAPRAVAIEMNARTTRASTWTVAFSHALDATTIRAANLCLSDEQSVVCTDDFQTAASIQSVAPIPADALSTTKITVVINERDSTASGSISLAFKRNAVRGEDQRVVEEYQLVLEEEIVLGGNDKPQIVSPLDGTLIELSLEEAKHTTQILIVISDEDRGDDLKVSVNAASNGIVDLSLEQDKLVSAAKILQTTLTIVALRSGDAAITIAVNDGMATATRVLTVRVNNTEPTIASVDDISFSAKERQTVAVIITDIDLNDAITVRLATDDGEVISIPMTTMQLMGSDDNATTRTANFEIAAISRGDAMVRITASDGAATATSQFSVTVDNTEPTIEPVSDISFSAGNQQTVMVVIGDADLNDNITVRLATDNDEAISIQMATMELMGGGDTKPVRTASFEIDAITRGNAMVTVTASDGAATATRQFNMTVDNTEPTIETVGDISFSAGNQQTVMVMISDADIKDDITVRLEANNDAISIASPTTVQLMETDDDATMQSASFEITAISRGDATVTITVVDGVATATSQFSVMVNNTEPTISPVENFSFSAGDRRVVTVAIGDADLKDDITVSLTTDNGVIFITTPTVQLIRADNNATTRIAHFHINAITQGSAMVIITAADGVATEMRVFQVTVDNTELRISTVNNFSFSAGEQRTVAVTISDADINDDITVSLTTNNGVIFITTPTVQLVGADNDTTTRTAHFHINAITQGSAMVTITAVDGVTTEMRVFQVTVDNTELRISTVNNFSFSAGERRAVTVVISDADINDDLTVSLTTNSKLISITTPTVRLMGADNNAITRTAHFKITAVSRGNAMVMITAGDGIATATSQFNMTINNTEPTISPVENFSFSAGKQQTVIVTITDADINDELAISLATNNEAIFISTPTVRLMGTDNIEAMRSAIFEITAVSRGNAMVIITASDDVATATSQFSSTVDNTEPTIKLVEGFSFSAGEQHIITVTVSDTDINDDITIHLKASNEAVAIATPTVSLLGTNNHTATRSARFAIRAITSSRTIVHIAAGDTQTTSTSLFEISIENTNPTLSTVDDVVLKVGDSYKLTVRVTDKDIGDSITITLRLDPDTIVSTSPSLVVVPGGRAQAQFELTAQNAGTTRITIEASDKKDDRVTRHFNVMVMNRALKLRTRIFLEAPLP